MSKFGLGYKHHDRDALYKSIAEGTEVFMESREKILERLRRMDAPGVIIDAVTKYPDYRFDVNKPVEQIGDIETPVRYWLRKAILTGWSTKMLHECIEDEFALKDRPWIGEAVSIFNGTIVKSITGLIPYRIETDRKTDLTISVSSMLSQHPELVGRRVRVTVEVLSEE